MQSLYHNLPSFGGVGQHNGKQYASKNEHYDKEERSLTLEMADAYESECGVISYMRSGSLKNGKITIKESVCLDKEKLIDFSLLTLEEPRAIENGKISLAEGCVISYDPILKAEIEPFDPVGLNSKQAWGTETLYRLHFKINAAKCNVTFTIE
jgi:hypothetical protein